MEAAKVVHKTVGPFMRRSTIGGLNNSARSDHNFWTIYWICLFTFGVIFTSIQVNSILTSYLEYHVTITNNLNYEPGLKFPAVTICNLNRINCIITYSLLNKTSYEIMDSGDTSLQSELDQLQDIFGQIGCYSQLCNYYSSSLPTIRDSEDYDYMVFNLAILPCQDVYTLKSQQYINEKICYFIYQMINYDGNQNNSASRAANQEAWEQGQCTLEMACTHYRTYILSLVQEGVFNLDYTSGAEIGSVCNESGNTATTTQAPPSSTSRRKRRKRQSRWVDQTEASYTYNISVLQDAFLQKFMALDASLRVKIGHQFLNTNMSYIMGEQQGMMTTCTFLGKDCKDPTMWYQFSDASYGNCYMFNSANSAAGNMTMAAIRNATLTGAANGLQVEMFVDQADYMINGLSPQAGFRVVIHDPEAFPLMDEDGIDLQPGTLSSIPIQMTNISRLPDPYESHCISSWNQTDLDDTIMTDNKPQYSMSVCNRFCLQVDIIDACDCYHIQLDMTLIDISKVHFKNQSKPCSLLPFTTNEDYVCFQNVLKQYEDQILQCDTCHLACVETVYATTSSTSMWPSNQFWTLLAQNEQGYDETQLNDPLIAPSVEAYIYNNYVKAEIYYQTLNVNQVTLAPAVSSSDLYASLGGAMALYLGIAVIMFFELVELVILVGFSLYDHYRGVNINQDYESQYGSQYTGSQYNGSAYGSRFGSGLVLPFRLPFGNPYGNQYGSQNVNQNGNQNGNQNDNQNDIEASESPTKKKKKHKKKKKQEKNKVQAQNITAGNFSALWQRY